MLEYARLVPECNLLYLSMPEHTRIWVNLPEVREWFLVYMFP